MGGDEQAEEQFSQQYAIAITEDAGGMARVRVPDVPGCEVVAPTVEKAVRRTRGAIAMRLEAAAQRGEPLPPPTELDDHITAGTFSDENVKWLTVEVGSSKRFSPRDFMRARRPELYSDSTSVREPVVDEAFLHFTLGQVTERREEVAFEHFCRRLAEKEICPNLITQTGPTGGGDSKVDTETYPVAEGISERWYVGNPERASKERWAFAFSAKRDWRPKIRDDVRKLAEAHRGYTVAYFMTNQQVPDRARGQMEDELREKWRLDVRILDRNWIADRVLANGHLALFESTLQVNLGGNRGRKLGRADAQRERELDDLDRTIDDADRYAGVGHQLAEDCLETALLARGLDRPRIEVDGRFDRAERAARNHGNERQLLRIMYHRAWTATCWYEDFAEFERLYKLAESLALGTNNVWDLERLTILWQFGVTLQRAGHAPKGDGTWAIRTAELRRALKAIAVDGGRPTSSLMARSQLAIMAMSEEPSNKSLTSGLTEIAGILATARDHLDYPFDSMAMVVEGMVNLAGSQPDLDHLLEQVIEMQQERSGDAQGGRMRLQRALACLDAKRYKEAIEQAGKAQLLLGRGGADADFLPALFATACAYEAMGLLWAARANYAFALHWVLRDLDTTGELPADMYQPLNRLIWLEIELGRVPQALCWLELHRTTLNVANVDEAHIERLHEEGALMDAILAIVVLRTPWPDLPKLDRAPGILGALDLHMSRLAAMFLLGYEAAVKSETGFDAPEEFFAKLLGQPAAHDVAEHADWSARRPFSLRTVLFGCRIELLANGGHASLLLGETILAFIESFLATSGMSGGKISGRAELCIEVIARQGAKRPFGHDLVEDNTGETRIVVAHPDEFVKVVDAKYHTKMVELLAQVLAQLWMPIGSEEIEALFAEDRAQDRASLTAQLPVVLPGMLGQEAKIEAKDWMALGSESLALQRTTPWRPPRDALPSSDTTDAADKRSSQDWTTSGLDAARHRDVKVISVLNLPLWDRARWKGLAYTFPRSGSDIPEMHFLFENIEAGRKIFRGWLQKFGAVDREDRIALTLVTGVDSAHPDWYRLIVSHRDADVLDSSGRIFGLFLRAQEMNPLDDRNLSQFLARYSRFGRYRIAPMEHRREFESMPSKTQAWGPPRIRIEKKLMKIVPAWKIGPDDFLRPGLEGVEQPVVPTGETDPPFFRPSTGRIQPAPRK